MTLAEAAQRCGPELFELARRHGFPEPEASPGGTEFYSRREVATWLARAGHDVPEEPRALLIADRALRLADVLEGADVPPGALHALGLPIT
ncbi:hypothetical protein [Streptomyces eurythermus]|uniref:hypothetical protein n=1 Tax=Streptomyces eurythermus TaxID=42237 RepID=UPI0036FCD122